MKVKVQSSELSRMMKTIVRCLDTKGITDKSNILITCTEDALTIRATNGTAYAEMSTRIIGGEDESFCVDGKMFDKVLSGCSGEVTIETNETTCVIRSSGRTRLPIVKARIPEMETVTGTNVRIDYEGFRNCYDKVAYAVSNDILRLVLTGVLMEVSGGTMTMVALDGFQLAANTCPCAGDDVRAVVPNSFMKLIATSFLPGDSITLTVGSTRIMAESMRDRISCGLLAGEYVDYNRILPESFKTECMVKVSALKDALKSGSVVNTKNNLVKLKIDGDKLFVMSNSEEADYEAEIDCETQGDGLTIAFNQKYLMNTINSISGDEAVMKFNSSVNPCVVQARDEDGIHLILPVRTQG